jgi:glutamate-1-semialdehyde 2,1-aminomutase
LESLGARLSEHIEAAAARGHPIRVNQVGSVLQMYWGVERAPQSYAEACRSDRAVVSSIAEEQLRSGALVAPRGLMLLSAAHTTADVDALGVGLLQAVEERRVGVESANGETR